MISKHVANAQPNGELYHGDDCIAVIQNPTAFGDIKSCTLYDFMHPAVNLCDKNTHVWGAKSRPGFGKVVSCSYVLATFDNSKIYSIVIFKDRQQTLAMCKPGDSGTVVIFDEPVSPSMFAICMVMGKLTSDRKNENREKTSDKNRYSMV